MKNQQQNVRFFNFVHITKITGNVLQFFVPRIIINHRPKRVNKNSLKYEKGRKTVKKGGTVSYGEVYCDTRASKGQERSKCGLR